MPTSSTFSATVYEPRHNKTNKMAVPPAKTQISLDIRPVRSESSLSAWRKLGPLATHWAHSEVWSDWVDSQADLSLRWVHTHFVGFVMSRLIFGIIENDALIPKGQKKHYHEVQKDLNSLLLVKIWTVQVERLYI